MKFILSFIFVFFFFKQKTAYEMRISDWSSDVCSSDLFAELIAEIQMINGTCAVVEHGLLDEPLSQRLDEKIYITLRGSGRNSDMMKSFDALGQLHPIGRASCRERGCQSV